MKGVWPRDGIAYVSDDTASLITRPQLQAFEQIRLIWSRTVGHAAVVRHQLRAVLAESRTQFALLRPREVQALSERQDVGVGQVPDGNSEQERVLRTQSTRSFQQERVCTGQTGERWAQVLCWADVRRARANIPARLHQRKHTLCAAPPCHPRRVVAPPPCPLAVQA